MSCDYSVYDKDQQTEACDLTLSQFRRSPVLLGVQDAIVDQAIDLYKACIDGMQLKCLDDATGEQLDVIGRIVGQDRELENYGEKNWFKYNSNQKTYNTTLNYVSGAPIGGDLPASDSIYKQLIYAKIFRNHVKYGSIPEILQFVKIIYGIDISIRNEGKSDISLIVPANTPTYIVQNLTKVNDSATAEQVYFLPIPSTGRIIDVIYKPKNALRYNSRLPGEGYNQANYAQ